MAGGSEDVPAPRRPAGGPDDERVLRGLVMDWGGVLTASLDGAMVSWAEHDQVDFDHFREVMAQWVGRRREQDGDLATASVAELEEAADLGPAGNSPVHRLERGEISVAEFEVVLAAKLAERGSPVAAPGLLNRMMAGLVSLDERMTGLVLRAKRAGIQTALLSNSWGNEYPEQIWQGMFDAVVISGEVGMRKPESRIFTFTAQRLGLPARECVMVDDLAHNVAGAVAAGMVGVLHRSYDETVAELEVLLGVSLR